MIDVVVTQRRDEAEGICSFELAAVDGAPLPPFEPGAHIDVHLPAGLIRQYSLCPPAERPGRYLVAVLREPASRGGSAAMHALQVGARLRIGLPRNHFPLAPDAEYSVLLAGGIGITPLLSMAEHLAARGRTFTLHYCTRSASRMAFSGRIQGSALARHAHFHFDDQGIEQKLDLDAALGPPPPGVHLYVCGPSGFMDWVLAGARARGWPEGQLHREYFAAPVRTDEAIDSAFEVQIGRGGPSYTVPAGRSVIEILAAKGVEIPVSCEQGVCGTCLTRVLDGEPEHRDSFLTEQERAANDCFTPCCSRSRSSRLVLDL